MSSNTTFTLQTLDGGSNPQDPSQAGLEASLDIQYTVGVATGVPTTFISVGLSNVNGFIDVANFLLSQANPPNVLTTSYGFDEGFISSRVARYVCSIPSSLAFTYPLLSQQPVQPVRSARRPRRLGPLFLWRRWRLRLAAQQLLHHIRPHLPLRLPLRDFRWRIPRRPRDRGWPLRWGLLEHL